MCQIKSNTSGIGDYVKYFISGLENIFDRLNVESKREYTKFYYEKISFYGLEKAKVTMMDWVNGWKIGKLSDCFYMKNAKKMLKL